MDDRSSGDDVMSCRSLHDPHGDHPLHLCGARLDLDLAGRPRIPW